MKKSIEPNIADLVNNWLKSYNLNYKLEQESLNPEIDKALDDYFSKNGGTGGNRPDAKVLLSDKNLEQFPILIEYKGYKDKLIKLDINNQIENKTNQNDPNFKNINSYAVNGAVHYANAVLHHTSYKDIIAIGVTGYKDNQDKIHHEIGVYLVSKSNFGMGQEIGKYVDLSFLEKNNFDEFINKAKSLKLTQVELDFLKEKREKEIDISLSRLNNDIYKNEKGLAENDRVYLVAASIISTLGVPNKIKPLDKSDLESSTEQGNTDGDIILRKINAFLEAKKIPYEKKSLILRTLENTLTSVNINKPRNGESQLKRVFVKIIDELGIYYKIGLNTDFTGKLFNEMYGWLGFSQDKLNDVVLTPAYVSTLLVKLARINKDSYVWDFATGSAGLLVAAMNEMLIDGKDQIKSPNELIQKELKIKAEQLLGLELLPNVYMLAILNMILMGDGSSNILNKDSLNDFDGNYGFGKTNEKFPANAFILNPPYSADGNGMNFVEKALNMMERGYAAIIIQNSAGSGKARDYNKRILQKHTLIASIKMPIDVFIGKASVQTNIYVFKINEKHHEDELVKFIDFSNDGYLRTNRKKANNNLKDTGDAKERYKELVDLVRFGKSKLKLFTNKEFFENTINPDNGSDWNQLSPKDNLPDLHDFQLNINQHISYVLSNILLKKDNTNHEFEESLKLENTLKSVNWKEYRLDELFEKIKVTSLKYKTADLPDKANSEFDLPALTAGIQNQGLNNFVPRHGATILKNVITISANGANTGATFYQSEEFTVLQDAYAIRWIFDDTLLNDNQYIFLQNSVSKAIFGNYEWTNKAGWERIKSHTIKIPIFNNEIDFKFMDDFISNIKKTIMIKVKKYLEENI